MPKEIKQQVCPKGDWNTRGCSPKGIGKQRDCVPKRTGKQGDCIPNDIGDKWDCIQRGLENNEGIVFLRGLDKKGLYP